MMTGKGWWPVYSHLYHMSHSLIKMSFVTNFLSTFSFIFDDSLPSCKCLCPPDVFFFNVKLF